MMGSTDSFHLTPTTRPMKSQLVLTSLLLAATVRTMPAAEQILVDWNHTWKYFHSQSDDPTLDDAAIDNTGAGIAPNAGPDLIYTNFNGTINPAGAWFARESDFTGPSGYATVFGKGFNIDGALIGDVNNYSSYDGGEGPGPLGYDAMDYFGRGLELTAFATGLTKTPATRRFASYFRTTFTALQEYTKPRIRMLLDDNAVIYYDGVAVANVNRSNGTITYTDAGSTDTTATNNEEGLTTGNGNEAVLQSFRLDQAGGPGVNTLTVGSQADSFVTVAVPRITAGTHTIAIIVRNSGNDSSDMGMAFQLRGDDAGIAAIVNSSIRQPGVDPVDPADDTFTASVTVIKLGTASTEWTSDVAPSVAGPYTYETAYTFGPFAASSPVTVTFTATGDPLLTATATLTAPAAPAVVGTNNLPGDPVIRISSAYAPWTQMAGLPLDRRIQLNNGNALSGVITDPVSLTAGTQKAILISLDHADTSTGSNAETNDSIRVELVTNVGTVNLTALYDADGTSPSNGAAMNGEDDLNLTFSDELNPDSLPESYTFTAHWLLAGVIPADATTVQVRILANNDSATEFLRIGNIQLRPHVDTDGDGVFDLFEEVAGTDPNSATSFFREVSHSLTSTLATITVSSSASRAYEFQASTDLLTWTRVAVPGAGGPGTFEVNTPGTGGDLPVTRALVDAPRGFGRVVVQLPTTDIVSP
jgi:hypothetical protein